MKWRACAAVRAVAATIGLDPDGRNYRTPPDGVASRLERVLLAEQRAQAPALDRVAELQERVEELEKIVELLTERLAKNGTATTLGRQGSGAAQRPANVTTAPDRPALRAHTG